MSGHGDTGTLSAASSGATVQVDPRPALGRSVQTAEQVNVDASGLARQIAAQTYLLEKPSGRAHDQAVALAREYFPGVSDASRARLVDAMTAQLEELRRGRNASTAPVHPQEVVGDPVEHARGEFVHEATDLVVRGAGLDFAFHRTYRHQTIGDGPVGARWDHGYHMHLRVSDQDAVLSMGGGRQEAYRRHALWDEAGDAYAYYVPPDGLDATLEPIGPRDAPVGWARRSPDGLRHVFTPEPGGSGTYLLTQIEDRWGNYLAFAYTTRPSGVAYIDRCEVNHPARWVQFSYDALDRIVRLADHTGRTWRYHYDAHGDLIGVTTPATPDQPKGATTEYRYTSREHTGALAHLLTDIFDAEGRHYLHTVYGIAPGQPDYNRVVKQRVGTGDYWFRYQPCEAPDLGLAPEDRPTMHCWVKERNGHEALYVYNAWGSLLWKEETDRGEGHPPRRVAWRYRYNRDGQLTASCTPEGRVTHVLTGRDHFLRVHGIAPSSAAADELWRHPGLTRDARRGFGRTLATVARATLQPTGGAFGWAERWGDVYAIRPGDLVVRHTYEPTYGQPLTTSDPRTTTASDPRTPHADALDTRYEYADNPARDLVRVVAPTVTQPDGTHVPVVTEILARDARGRVTRVRDAVGVETTTDYAPESAGAPAGFPIRTIVDPDGLALTTAHALDELGRVVRTTLPRAVGAPAGHFVVTQTYDARDRVIAATRATPLATETRTQYEAAGKPRRVDVDWTGPAGEAHGVVQRRFRYDEEHRLLKETFGSDDVGRQRRVSYNYNAAGLRSVEVRPNDQATLWKYDSRDQVARIIHGPGVGEQIETFCRDKDGRVIEHRSPVGRITRTTYDAFGRVVAVTDALGNITRTSYDAGGRPTVVRVFELDAASSPPTYTLLARTETHHDELGRAVRQVASRFETPPPPVTAAEVPTAYEAATVGTAVETQTFYDAAGRVVGVVDALGNTTTTDYDAAGRPWRVTDPTGNQVMTSFDAHGNAVRVDRVDRVHHATGSVVGQEVFTTTAEFDARDRKVRQVDALGNVTEVQYDSLDRVVRTIDPLRNVTEQDYDAFGDLVVVRQLRTTTGAGDGASLPPHEVRYERDASGVVKVRIDALGRRTEYRHDKSDRVVEERFPDGARVVTQYDLDGLVTAVRDAQGVVVRTAYDALARPVRTIVDAAEVDAGVTIEGVRQIDRSYDALGRLRTATNEVSALTTAFDSLGRPVAEATQVAATGQQLALSRAFDDAGRRVGLTYPGGRQLAYTHDAAGRVAAIRHVADGTGYPGAAGADRTVATYTYAGNRVRAVAYANRTTTAYTHDARGGVIDVHHTGPAGTLLRVQQLRDGAKAPRARVEQTATGSRGERFGYDARYQLGARVEDAAAPLFDLTPWLPATSPPAGAPQARQPLIDAAIGPRLGPVAPAGADAWVHDLVGNRERTRAEGVDTLYGSVDNRDRYASVAADGHTYDRAGNLLSDGKFKYVYDGFRRLVRIETATGAPVARYDYDPAGRRVVEARPGAPAVVIAYDGVDRIADYRDGVCVGQYVHGPAVDDPVELAAAGATHTYHLDLQGSVRVLSRADGTAAALYAYDPFGVLRLSSGPLLEPPGAPSATVATQPFGYAARPFEAATASYDARARCYVPHLGRFLQRDPAGAVDGHLYAYAGNHPLAFGDPSGLARAEMATEGGWDYNPSLANRCPGACHDGPTTTRRVNFVPGSLTARQARDIDDAALGPQTPFEATLRSGGATATHAFGGVGTERTSPAIHAAAVLVSRPREPAVLVGYDVTYGRAQTSDYNWATFRGRGGQNLSERETSGALETPLFDPIDLISGAVAGKALARGGARAAMGRPAGPRVATGLIPRGAAAVEGGGATVELFHGTTSAGARSILREGLRPISTNTAPFPAGSFFTHVGAEGQVAASHWAGRSAGLYGGNPVLLRGTMSAEVFESLSAQGLIRTVPTPGLPFFPPQTVILPKGLAAASSATKWSVAPLSF